MNALAVQVLAALPQTQCTRCGYPDCAAYADAVARQEAGINQCPPGGAEGIARLAAITGLPTLPLNPAHGSERARGVAIVDEAWCIGCTLCLKVCPTDAIVGSNKLMHTVIEHRCNGCELCLRVCPVDCIAMEPVTGDRTGWAAWSSDQAAQSRDWYAFHQWRTRREAGEHELRLEKKAQAKLADLPAHSLHTDPEVLERKRAVIEAALARARERKAQRGGPGDGGPA